jgi:phosphatidate phosphatase APP1
MSEWLDSFTRIASRIEKRFDLLKFNVKVRSGWLDPVQIQPYRGHGTAERLYLKGRVLEYKGISSASDADSIWKNLLNMYRRFDSDEIPGARLRVRQGDQEFEAITDHEGYFDLEIEPQPQLRLERVWHEIELTLIEPKAEGQRRERTVGHCLVPPPKSEFGIISDIDDTIVLTGATDPLTMARIVVLNNPHTRLPFEGVAAFYQALRKGGDGVGYNPIFYVSSSPWNLYDLLIDFLNINGIPLGPLFLRDVGLEKDRLIKSGHHEHKLKQIRTILNTHSELPFILIGDSGQEDPEIYQEVVHQYPGRIQAIYIRDVSLEDRDGSIRNIIKAANERGVEMLLVPDTVTAAEHAVGRGFITSDALPDIRAEKAKDQQAPTLAEQIPVVGPVAAPDAAKLDDTAST